MPVLTPAALKKQIAAGALAPIYLLFGDDELEKAELAADFETAIDEGLRAFNVERFYGGEATLDDLLDAAGTWPMMADRRLLIVLRAERMLAPKKETEATLKGLEAFEDYVQKPYPHATIVLASAGLDERRRVTKLLLSRATVVRCGDIEDLADAERWIRARLSGAGATSDPQAVRLLAALAGPDISRLRADVERLLLYAAGQKTITVDDVREVAGPASAHDEWSVARAIERGQVAVALRELGVALDTGAVPYVVVGQLAWVARTKLPPPRVGDAVEAVFRTDVAIKSSAGDPRVLLERLVVELCGVTASDGRASSGGR